MGIVWSVESSLGSRLHAASDSQARLTGRGPVVLPTTSGVQFHGLGNGTCGTGA